MRGLIDGGVDLLLLETIFDTLNAKAAHRRDRERVRGAGRPPAADDLGDDHRPQRPHAVGPDARRVLRLDRHAQAVQRRHQLRARRARHAPVPRRARAHRRVLRQLLSERRPAERVRRVRRAAGRDRARSCASSPTSGFVNIVGGCCGTTPDHIAAIAAAVEGCRAARCDRWSTSATSGIAIRQSDALHPVRRPRDADDPPRLELPDDRRADQRHRLGASSRG